MMLMRHNVKLTNMSAIFYDLKEILAMNGDAGNQCSLNKTHSGKLAQSKRMDFGCSRTEEVDHLALKTSNEFILTINVSAIPFTTTCRVDPLIVAVVLYHVEFGAKTSSGLTCTHQYNYRING